MRSILTPSFRILALAAVLLAAAIAPAAAVTSATYEKQVITRTNTHRANHDRVAVRAQTCADRWAEGQARWMAKHKTLKHRSGRLRQIIEDCDFAGVSENIAYGYASGNRTVDAWMTSSGHRANILATSMRYIGVGAVKDGHGVWWVSQVFGRK